MDARSDAELVGRYLAGEAEAFDALLERHQDAVYGYLRRLTRDPDDAADLFQETMLRVIRHLRDKYAERGQFRSWLFRLAHHAAIDHLRRRRAHISLDADPPGDGLPWHERLADDNDSPFGAAVAAEDWRRLERAAAMLTREQQEVFWLRALGELSFQEIADTVGCPLNTALGRMHDAVRKLQTAMGDVPSEARPQRKTER